MDIPRKLLITEEVVRNSAIGQLIKASVKKKTQNSKSKSFTRPLGGGCLARGVFFFVFVATSQLRRRRRQEQNKNAMRFGFLANYHTRTRTRTHTFI